MKVLKPERRKISLQRKAVSTLNYVCLIIFIIGGALFVQNYYKRSWQGMLQGAGDNIGRQYGSGLTNGHDHTESDSFSIEVKTAGLNNPTLITFTAGSGSSSSIRKIESLDETWPQ